MYLAMFVNKYFNLMLKAGVHLNLNEVVRGLKKG